MATETPEVVRAYEMICEAAEIIERHAVTPIVATRSAALFAECDVRSRAVHDVWKAARSVRELYDPVATRSIQRPSASPADHPA